MALDPRLLEILACPEDKGPLLYFAADGLLYNPRLKKKYLVEADVPNLLVTEATTADVTEHERLLQKAQAERVAPNW
jgi:uncharacterized protein YbaR (Trm112 family)